jgi:glycosyltransferase involved in cell wall biosynthesis
MAYKLAIITTHPVQYNAPFFALLSTRGLVEVKVFYTWGEGVLKEKYDPGFGKVIQWDIPLLQGYDYCFVKNISKKPGSTHFTGIDNPSLVAEIKEWKADAILVYGWSFKSHLRCLRYFHNKLPVYFKGDSTLLDEQPGLKQLARRLFLKWVYGFVDGALYVGEANKKYFLKHGFKQSRLLFAPHAVDNNRFEKKEESIREAATIRTRLHIPLEDTVFLFAGKMEKKKNPLLLLQVFQTLPRGNVHLVMAGNGELEAELKTLATGNTHVHFLPFQNQLMMPALYQLCDVFVLPSLGPGETWGLAVNEAMAAGKAVLVSDACGVAVDLVKEGKNGYSFKRNDAEDLKDKMLRLTDIKKDLLLMGAASVSMIKSWSFEKNAEVIEYLMNKEKS